MADQRHRRAGDELSMANLDTAFGEATFRLVDGEPHVISADERIGISVQLLADAPELLPVDDSGCLLLAGDPRYRYRPVSFAGPIRDRAGPVAVVVCERVNPPEGG